MDTTTKRPARFPRKTVCVLAAAFLFMLSSCVFLSDSPEVPRDLPAGHTIREIDESVKDEILETFERINENPVVGASSTADKIRFLEPDLYYGLVDRGEAILPEVLSILGENNSGAPGEQYTMLCRDILANMGYKDFPDKGYGTWFEKHGIEFYEMYVGPYTSPEKPERAWDRATAYCLEKGYFNVWPANPDVYWPEPEDANAPPYYRWEPMLRDWISKDAYYDAELGFIIQEEPIDFEYWEAFMFPDGK